MTWLPLADRDPVPGDPFGAGDLGAYFTSEAAKFRSIMGELNRLDAGLWRGEAASAFTQRRMRLVPHLEALASRWDHAAAALKAWAMAMDDAKTLARRALADAQHAEERLRWARAGLEDAEKRAADDLVARLTSLPVGTSPPPGTGPAPNADPDLTWWRSKVCEHEADLAAARTILAQAEELYENGSRRCEAALHAAADDGIENRGGFLAGARRAIHGAVQRFPQIKTFAKYMGLAAGALGIAAAMLTGVGALPLAAFIVGGLATTLDVALYVSGDGAWTAVAWDAFGLLTLGASRAFASAARGTAAVDAAIDADRLRRGGSLKGIFAEAARGGERLSGAAARSQRLAQYDKWKVFRPEAAEGLFPDGRNWLRAVTFWKEIKIPPKDVVDLSKAATRYTRVSRALEGVSVADDIRGTATSAREIRAEEGN